MIVTRSETSDEATRTFSATVEKLQRLDVATAYVDLLKEVDGLRCVLTRKLLLEADPW